MGEAEQLLGALFAGEKAGAEKFIDQYGRLIWHVVLKRLNSSALRVQPEDIFGEIIVHLFARDFAVLRSFKGRATFTTWLFRVVWCKALEVAEKEKKYKDRIVMPSQMSHNSEDERADFWAQFEDMSSEDDSDIDEFMRKREAVRKAITMLSGDRKAFITDMVFNKLTTEQMMRKYSLNSNNSVYSRKSKIIDELKSLVKKMEKDQ